MAKSPAAASPAETTDLPNPAIITQGDGTAAASSIVEGALRTPIPVQVPGPGAGALQVAEPSTGFETHPLDQESRDPRERGGGGLDPLGHPFLRSASILDTASASVDADAVKGRRLVMAATNILRNGREYRARDRLPVDFAAYTELVQIGAVVATPWDALERED